MSRGQEILLGLGILIGTPIAYPFIMDEIWSWLSVSIQPAMPDNAWGDAFMAGAPIGILIVIMAFGVLFLIGTMHGKDHRDIER